MKVKPKRRTIEVLTQEIKAIQARQTAHEQLLTALIRLDEEVNDCPRCDNAHDDASQSLPWDKSVAMQVVREEIEQPRVWAKLCEVTPFGIELEEHYYTFTGYEDMLGQRVIAELKMHQLSIYKEDCSLIFRTDFPNTRLFI